MYSCPMHPEIQEPKPGRCPKCGMNLILEKNINTSKMIDSKLESESYLPLISILALIILVSSTITFKDLISGTFAWQKSVSYFMVGFFIVFSGFKLIDLKGFAQGYSTYDLLARRFFPYGYIYPFIELSFGLVMILNYSLRTLLLLEFFIMIFSGLGVAIKLAKKEKFQCVCLGTFLEVPLTKVTLIEDFGMATLALIMLLFSSN